MLVSQRRLLNRSPSSINSSRRITLSRVCVLPWKSILRTKNCLPSSTFIVMSTLLVPATGSGSGSGTKSM